MALKKDLIRLIPFQPCHQMLCMSKHVEGVKSYFDIQPLSCASRYIQFDR